jgi:hypothetical protein
MSLGQPINIRLPIEKQQQYEKEAAIKNLPLRTYLRDRLCESDQLNESINSLKKEMGYLSAVVSQPKVQTSEGNEQIFQEILALKEQMKHNLNVQPQNLPSGKEMGVLLELLLLLRQIAQPQKVQVAQEELKRLGIEVWRA